MVSMGLTILDAAAAAKSLQSCLTLCNPMDCSPPGSSVHEIFEARILEWVAMPFFGGSSQPREGGRWILYHRATWEAPLFRVRIVISVGELELMCYFFFRVILLPI